MRRMLLVACIACGSSSKPETAQVHEYEWTEIKLPGIHIFEVHDDGPQPADYDQHNLYLVRDGNDAHLRGKDAMRAVVDAKVTDPMQLATFSTLFLDRYGGRVETAPPPTVTDGVLAYWRHEGGMSYELIRVEVVLATLERSEKSKQQIDREANH